MNIVGHTRQHEYEPDSTMFIFESPLLWPSTTDTSSRKLGSFVDE